MAERTLPGLGLTGFWDLGANNWKGGMDLNLRKLSLLVQLSVLSMTTPLPSTGLADGMIYIIPSGGDAKKIAIRDNGAWVNYDPTEGMVAWVKDTDKFVKFDGAAWVDLITAGGADFILAMFFASTLGASEMLMRYVTKTPFDLTTLANSIASAGTASTGTQVLTIAKNGSSIGTVTFTASATGVIAGAGATFAVDDILTVTAGATPDATLANVSLTLKGIKL